MIVVSISDETLYRLYRYTDPALQALAARVTKEYSPLLVRDLQEDFECLKDLVNDRGGCSEICETT